MSVSFLTIFPPSVLNIFDPFDSLTQLPGYNVLHQIRKNRRGGGKYICTRVAVLQSAIRSGHKFGSSGIS